MVARLGPPILELLEQHLSACPRKDVPMPSAICATSSSALLRPTARSLAVDHRCHWRSPPTRDAAPNVVHSPRVRQCWEPLGSCKHRVPSTRSPPGLCAACQDQRAVRLLQPVTTVGGCRGDRYVADACARLGAAREAPDRAHQGEEPSRGQAS